LLTTPILGSEVPGDFSRVNPLALLRPRRERPGSRAAECSQQFPPSDGNCHTLVPREVRKETIQRHERAVSPFKEGRMLVASTSVGGFGFSGKAQNEQMFSGLHPKRTSDPRAEYMLFPPPAFCECCHRLLAPRGVAVCRRAIPVITERERPRPRRARRHSSRLHDAADDDAINEHVEGLMDVCAPLSNDGADLVRNLGYGSFTLHHTTGDKFTTGHITARPWK